MANNNVPTFPYAAPSDTVLTVASDNAETTLAADIGSNDTSIDVSDASNFNVPCLIVIDGEKILVRTKSTNTLTNCVRGFDDSTNDIHSNGTSVFGYILAYQHNQMAVEMESVSSYIFSADFTGFQRSENILTYSEDFSQSYWAKSSGVTIEAGMDLLPNGAESSVLLEGSSSGYNMISAVPVGLVVGATYTFSVYFKYDSVQWIQIGQNLAGPEHRWAWFDIQNGVVGTIGALANAAIVPVGDGWFRCIVVTTCTNLTNKAFEIALTEGDGDGAYIGTDTNFALICAAQVRTGGLDGSHTYIKTSGTTFSLIGSGDLILDEGDLS